MSSLPPKADIKDANGMSAKDHSMVTQAEAEVSAAADPDIIISGSRWIFHFETVQNSRHEN
jgi:hypothetical protein